MSAAETGHLVLSTIHTLDAAESINRMLEFFPPNHHQQVRSMLATTLRGVISQRLVRATNGGRVPVCEILRMTGRARDKILKPSEAIDLTTVITEGGYDGMQTFDQALYTHVKAERITIEDAMMSATSPHDFKLLLEAEGRRGTTMDDVPTSYEDDDEPDNGDLPERTDGFRTTMDDVPSAM
jgi:twitching motility protein PilT